jgi:hypothetical protein
VRESGKDMESKCTFKSSTQFSLHPEDEMLAEGNRSHHLLAELKKQASRKE